jgi:hypothetical protein
MRHHTGWVAGDDDRDGSWPDRDTGPMTVGHRWDEARTGVEIRRLRSEKGFVP